MSSEISMKIFKRVWDKGKMKQGRLEVEAGWWGNVDSVNCSYYIYVYLKICLYLKESAGNNNRYLICLSVILSIWVFFLNLLVLFWNVLK